jgi:hypothetical protein
MGGGYRDTVGAEAIEEVRQVGRAQERAALVGEIQRAGVWIHVPL